MSNINAYDSENLRDSLRNIIFLMPPEGLLFEFSQLVSPLILKTYSNRPKKLPKKRSLHLFSATHKSLAVN